MDYFEVITNAQTGEQTIRPYTQEEIAVLEAAQAATLEAERNKLKITFAQLLIGLVTEGWITEAEGDAWADGVLPVPVTTLIDSLPEGQRFAARTRAKRPSEVLRQDSLVQALAVSQGRTPEELDNFFRIYSEV